MRLTAAISVIFVSCFCRSIAADEHSAKLEFFESKIRPILVQHCYQCHSTESGNSRGGLLLDSRNGWMVGGDSGPAIVPGKPDESFLLLAINQSGEMSDMPPKSHLSAQVVDDFRRWIAEGAVDPREGTVAEEKESIDIDAGREFWSFQPRRKIEAGESIDGWIIPQAPVASADTLVRRLFLDLIGLPPTPAQRQEFLELYEEHSPEYAVDRFADQLLAQDEFGEKWARHWLDIARYADSNGGDFNLTFHEAWRYRNYVIGAFNNDMPYDQFLIEQIAGDLLPYGSAEQGNRQLIATGFLMVAAKMLTERDKPKMHLDIADEQLDTIGRSIMGLTLGCARCHDHKFDPIPTADYYAMAGILHSTRVADRVLMNNVNVTGWTNTDLLLDDETKAQIIEQQARIKKAEEKLKELQTELVAYGVTVDDTEAATKGPWRKSTHRPNRIGAHYLATDKNKAPCSITWRAKLPEAGKYELRVSFGGGSGLATKAKYLVKHAEGESKLVVDQSVKPSIDGLWQPIGQFEFGKSAEVQLTDKDAGGHVIADAIQLVPLQQLEEDEKPDGNARLLAHIKKLEKDLKAAKTKLPEPSQAMAAMDNTGERLGDLNIRIRGEVRNLGPVAARGFLQVASKSGSEQNQIPNDESGRVQLAHWLTDPAHPLTSRVMANRVWQHLFGQGIVVTSDNFGLRGVAPSHPELLDYLAERFVESGWSVKTLIREIVQSQAYQQAVVVNLADDPENAKFQRQNRRPAPAETIRDSILAIAGELDSTRRKSAVKQLGTYAIATSGARDASLAQTGELRQRSIYLPVVRGAVPPSLAVFDFPNPDLVTGKRAATTVPTQALFMMNSPFVREMAEALSAKFRDELSLEQIVQQLYQRILIRNAASDDLAMATRYIQEALDNGKTRRQAIASFVQVLFSSTEFRFIE
ncbi:MAG: DUF1553 domain-containing protein [Planctomycetota bacterium]